jgi:glucose/arabinose dehydrogenase/mono/diheme cytochrome c family protein
MGGSHFALAGGASSCPSESAPKKMLPESNRSEGTVGASRQRKENCRGPGGNMKRSIGIIIALFCAATVLLFVGRTQLASPPGGAGSQTCPNDTGLKLPAGFCATVFADGIGHTRQMVVAPDGVVYVNTWSGRYFGNTPPHPGGFLVALQAKNGSGKADVIERFGATPETGGAGGNGIALYKSAIYAEINDRIERYALESGSIAPKGAPVTILSGLPLTGDHPMHPFIIDSAGDIYIDDATPTNACQVKNRVPQSPGEMPCTQLETRGGIWRYDANKKDQVFSAAGRYATGIRNAEGLAFDDSGNLFSTQHGRDQLHANWPQFYRPDQEATLPAEELLLIKQGGDYGWPECYYDNFVEKLVLAPEYGGDGKKIGVCSEKTAPVAAFPAHWGPNGMVHYDQKQFPDRYRHGMFIAFHGSWDRAPYAQGGYNVVFQPLSGVNASGRCEIFADGFAGADKSPQGAKHRPSGLAVGPDGALYISDDVAGTIYRVVYRGGTFDASSITPCPSLTASAGPVVATPARPPEGTHPNAGRESSAANPPVPAGATRAMVALGNRIYHGQAGGATCTGCHGDNAKGTPLGPDLTGTKWLWSHGSYAGIAKTITNGVPQPKNYRSPMPPLGGAQLTPEQVKAVAAYIWSISHASAPAAH